MVHEERYDLISIHSLRVEGDRRWRQKCLEICAFQSTPSVWRETATQLKSEREQRISIHSLRVEGDQKHLLDNTLVMISIHSLRVEGDPDASGKSGIQSFQSTPSVWRETFPDLSPKVPISNFNPLPPCGGRPHWQKM
ncbi:unknown [Ruminococcus sp. CAG:330]|nr:unknown [Ruminococcus sp. CAG:330]